ncbi:MAG: hypothetical protein GX901_01900 [Lentisphaerae bacterium]|nr:hypothetical protein [Lentisphaerota bacterium]
MNRILICDSGLGGLDILARLLEQLRTRGCRSKNLELHYFNAWPRADCGYNQLPDDASRRQVFASALQGMAAFEPQLCLIACNTLSLLFEQIKEQQAFNFPILDMLEPATGFFFAAMQEDPKLQMLILGTESTVRSGVYENRLIKAGLAPARLRAFACPGLATALEKSFRGDDIQRHMAAAAAFAKAEFSGDAGLALALCCTHYGYASALWENVFAAQLQRKPLLLNPNASLLHAQLWQDFCNGGITPRVQISIHSRFALSEDKLEYFALHFQDKHPELAEALRRPIVNDKLFQVD